ncbi:MAG: hypothetical protein CMF51_02530 [Legionellales bacterium]|nr:hypothetical protein [Legionellales bacterium]
MNYYAKFKRCLLLYAVFILSPAYAAHTLLPNPTWSTHPHQTILTWKLSQHLKLNTDSIHINVDQRPRAYEIIAPADDHPSSLRTGLIKIGIPIQKNDKYYQVTFQGCSDIGLCFPPQHDTYSSHPLTVYSILERIMALLLAGLLLAFSPCALPIAPIALSSIGAASTRGHHVRNAGYFLTGLTVSYGLLGLSIYWLNLQLQSFTQTPWINLFAAALTALSGLALIEINSTLTRYFYRFIQSFLPQQGAGLHLSTTGAITMLIATPCIAPPMIAALTWASEMHTPWVAALGVAAMGLGLGLPSSIAAVLGFRLPHLMRHPTHIQSITGILLISLSVIFFSRTLHPYLTISLLILWCFIILTMVLKFTARHHRITSSITACLCAIGLYVTVLEPMTLPSQLNASKTQHLTSLEQWHQGSNRSTPTLLYFHANWCISCHTLEQHQFKQSDTHHLLQNYHIIRVNLTQTTPETRALMKKFHVIAPPTLLIFKPHYPHPIRLEGVPTHQALNQALQQSPSLSSDKT